MKKVRFFERDTRDPMGDVVLDIIIPAIITLLATIPLGWLLLEWRRRHYLGKLQHITTESCAYNKQKYGHILDWNKHCLLVNNQPSKIYFMCIEYSHSVEWRVSLLAYPRCRSMGNHFNEIQASWIELYSHLFPLGVPFFSTWQI